jgi:hypothetical protein
MRLQAVRFFLAGVLLSGVLFPVGHAQQSTVAPEVAQAAADPIVGSWKLNVGESTNSTAESELITITRQGNQFQIVFQATQSNGYNPHYQVMTEMKGENSKLVDTDGKPMNDEWRVSRNQPNAFVVDSIGPFGGWKKEYAVSTDGKTLTVYELPELSSAPGTIIGGKMDSNGVIHPVHPVLVFEKISDTEGRTMSQRMVDSNAAEQALAAEKGAASAALDATACGMAHDQTGSPEATANQSTWHEYTCPKEYALTTYGFAITLPQAPEETGVIDGTQYRLYWNDSWDADTQIVVNLTAIKTPTDCAGWMASARKSLNQPLPAPFANLKPIAKSHEVMISGNPSIEGEFPGPRRTEYYRDQCLSGTVFHFYARWPPRQARPEIVNRILDSFRLVKSDVKQ